MEKDSMNFKFLASQERIALSQYNMIECTVSPHSLNIKQLAMKLIIRTFNPIKFPFMVLLTNLERPSKLGANISLLLRKQSFM